jgi:multidrug efflux pump subunit AcrA (membrane-fusion protein)
MRIAPLPSSPDKYDVSVALDLGAEDTGLMPGMACSVKFVPYTKLNAIAIPTACIHDQDDRSIVYVVSKQGKHHVREVKLGPSHGGETEILSGLHEGEEILLQKPTPQEGGMKAAPMKAKGATP